MSAEGTTPYRELQGESTEGRRGRPRYSTASITTESNCFIARW